ncbi:MAG: RNA-binding protein [Candidatus Nitrosoabyssus spongiisocia]|nr:MAG: RNA-binding protein [Nitrosopumilaceae archaeon AB1(1)]
MSLVDAKASLDKISKSLDTKLDAREFLIRNTRDIVTLASQAIISIHKEDIRTAKVKINKATKLLEKYRKKSKGGLNKYLQMPEQELVEASALLCIVQKKNIPSIKSLNVSEESYVLGLLDCIGECKRLVYDKIRKDKVKEASRVFELMEDLYLHLYPFAAQDKILREARRKLDVNRILVENVRATLTEDIRRTKLLSDIVKSKLMNQ